MEVFGPMNGTYNAAELEELKTGGPVEPPDQIHRTIRKMTFEKTTAHLGILKYTFTFEGHEGVCFIDVEPGDYSNSNTIISFPEGRYRNIAKFPIRCSALKKVMP